MRDIRYKWNEGPNSVGVSNEVSLPQFKVLGHRQRAMEISLTTGTGTVAAVPLNILPKHIDFYVIPIFSYTFPKSRAIFYNQISKFNFWRFQR